MAAAVAPTRDEASQKDSGAWWKWAIVAAVVAWLVLRFQLLAFYKCPALAAARHPSVQPGSKFAKKWPQNIAGEWYHVVSWDPMVPDFCHSCATFDFNFTGATDTRGYEVIDNHYNTKCTLLGTSFPFPMTLHGAADPAQSGLYREALGFPPNPYNPMVYYDAKEDLLVTMGCSGWWPFGWAYFMEFYVMARKPDVSEKAVEKALDWLREIGYPPVPKGSPVPHISCVYDTPWWRFFAVGALLIYAIYYFDFSHHE